MKKISIIFLLLITTATIANAQFLPKSVIETNFKTIRPALIQKATLIKERQKKLLIEEYGFKAKQADTIATIQYNLTLFFQDSLYMCAKTKEERYAIYDTALAHYYTDLKNALKSDELVDKVKEDDERRSITHEFWMNGNHQFGANDRRFYTYLWHHSIKKKMFGFKDPYKNMYNDGPVNF